MVKGYCEREIIGEDVEAYGDRIYGRCLSASL